MAAPAPAAPAGRTAEALALLDRAEHEVRRLGRPDLVARVARQRDRVADPVSQVLVVGEFKKGKSALVNALLNLRVCPVDADIATAVPTVVRWGERAAATVVTEAAVPGGRSRADDPVLTRRPIPLAAVAAVATERGQQAVGEGELVHSVEVEVPRGLLRQGLVLIDTPGVGGGLASAHAAATLRALSLADAVLFVSDASQEYAAPELGFLRQATEICPTVICVLTKTDFYPEWRRILELDRGHLARAGLDYDLLPVASPLRHHALRTGDRQLDAESGFPRLAAALRSEVLGRRELLDLRASAATVRNALGQLTTALAAEHAILTDPGGTGALVERLERAQRQADRLRGAAARWQQTLNDRFADLGSNVEMDLSVRLRAIRKDAADRIADGDPSKTWPELQRWLYQRTNEDLMAHYGELRAQADDAAGQVAAEFDDAVGKVVVELDLAGLELPLRGLRLGESKFDRASFLELGLMTMRGSASSMMITSAVGSIAALSGVAAVALLPVTAVLALALGGTVLRQSRQNQVRLHRAEASKAVQTYLEEAELVARKDARDALRRIHRGLRDFFAERAEELAASARQGLEATARAIKADHGARKQRVAQLDAELAHLRTLTAATERILRETRRAQAPPAGGVGAREGAA